MVTASVGGSRLSSQVEGTANNKPGNTPPVVEASDQEKVETRPKRKGRRVEGFSEQEVVEHGHEARRRHLRGEDTCRSGPTHFRGDARRCGGKAGDATMTTATALNRLRRPVSQGRADSPFYRAQRE